MMPLGKTNAKRIIKCLEKTEQKPISQLRGLSEENKKIIKGRRELWQ